MEPTDAEMQKARRTQRLLLVVMAVLIAAPIVVFVLQRR
jgi:hypothetical protein